MGDVESTSFSPFMSISTRSYARGYSNSGNVTNGVKWLLIANFAVFILYFFAVRTDLDLLFRECVLRPSEVVFHFKIWQLFTWLFLHDPNGFSHILFNMLSLWMFGTELERLWGTKRFLQYYFLCGIGAGICVIVASAVVGNMTEGTIGASGAIYGLLLAFGMLFPETPILLFFLFPVKAKYAVTIFGAIAFMLSIGAPGSGVSHVAHLGGMIFGYIFLKSRSPKTTFDPIAALRRQFRTWKLNRDKKKFQVYLRKNGSDRDRWVH